jgi:hypothetical protein
MRLSVENIGRGLALNCRYVGYYSIPDEEARKELSKSGFVGGRAYYMTGMFYLGAESSRTLQANETSDGRATLAVAGIYEGGPLEEINVLLCMDQFGKKYRFTHGKATAEVWPDPELIEKHGPVYVPDWTRALD